MKKNNFLKSMNRKADSKRQGKVKQNIRLGKKMFLIREHKKITSTYSRSSQ